jgi:hypothetical protein
LDAQDQLVPRQINHRPRFKQLQDADVSMNSINPSPARHADVRMDLVCIDRAAQADLMFWNLLGNALSTQEDRPATVLIVEPSGGDVVQEDRVREEVKEAVFRLTDLGLATVGFTGCDRKFIQRDETGFQVGDWSILMDTAARNVVVLVASVACQPGAGWVPVPPLRIARAVREKRDNRPRLIHMTQRLTPGLRQAGERGCPVAAEVLREEGCLPAAGAPEEGIEWFAHHVSRWAAFPPVLVSTDDVSSKNRLD